MKILSYIKYIVFLFLLYLFIYNPPLVFVTTSPVEWMIIPSLVFILVFSKWYSFIKLFQIELIIFICIILFSFVREAGFPESVFFRANVLLFFESLFIPFLLVVFYHKLPVKNNLFKDVILIGIIASLFTLIMIFSPTLNNFFRNELLKNDEFSEYLVLRNFGFSEGLTFSFSIVQGFVFAFVFYYSRFNSKLLFILPLLLISILFNARSGLIPVIFILTYFFIFDFKIKFFLFAILLGIFFYFMLFSTDLFKDSRETIEWAFDFFVQISDFMFENPEQAGGNTLTTLFEDMTIFPESTFTWLLGSGENIFLSSLGNSDIGYLILLNYGGIIYLFFIFIFVTYLFWRLRFLWKDHKWFIFLLFFSFLLGNMKGMFISVNPNFRLIMLLYCYLIYERKKQPDVLFFPIKIVEKRLKQIQF